ncbi:MAG: ATP-binding protein [Acidobacteriota bacterium]
MSLRLFQSLHFKMALGVIATILLLSALYFVWDYRFFRRQLIQELEKSSSDLSEVTLHGFMELAMKGRHPELLQQAAEKLAADTSILGIQVLDLSGSVRFSSDPSDLHRRFTLQDQGCRECHQLSRPPGTVFLRVGGEQVLREVRPIPNRKECHSCHDPGPRNNGLLILDLPTSGTWARLRANLYEMLIKAGLTVTAILLVLGVLLNKLVILRIRSLVRAAGRIRQGDFEAKARVFSGDEIGHLAGTLNRMAEGLQRYRGEVEKKERMRVSLLGRIVEAQEEERKSISLELHDQVGQSLSALLLTVQGDGWHHGLGEKLRRDLEGRIRRLIGVVHGIAWGMCPSILDDYGLKSALERFVAETSDQFGLAIDFQYSSPSGIDRLPSPIEVTLYRLAQEAVSNVLRHAGASRASVVVLCRRDEVRLLIEDNGCGFQVEAVQRKGTTSLGLTGMNERAGLCGGSCTIESEPGKGTTVRVSIPLEGI